MTVDNDLISRSALLGKKTRMTEYDESGCGEPVYVVRVDDIEDAPAVDAEPVRHGWWMQISCDDADPYFVCSACKYGTSTIYHDGEEMMYCPNCGSKLDAKVRT